MRLPSSFLALSAAVLTGAPALAADPPPPAAPAPAPAAPAPAVPAAPAPAPGAPAAAPAAPAPPAPMPAPAPLVPPGYGATAPLPPGYGMTPTPYGAPYGMAPAPYGMAPAPFGAPGAAPRPYGLWMGSPVVEDRRNKGMRIGGIVMFAIGAAATTAGAVVLMTSEFNGCQFLPLEGHASPALRRRREVVGIARQPLTSCDSGPAAGAVAMAIGAVLGLIGVPLFVVGNAPVLVPAPRMGLLAAEPRPAALPLPSVHVGAGTADLRWTF